MKHLDEDVVVKCACGLPMRQRNWADHWRTCYQASAVPVTEQDIRDLEHHEAHLAAEEQSYRTWLDTNYRVA